VKTIRIKEVQGTGNPEYNTCSRVGKSETLDKKRNSANIMYSATSGRK